MKADLPGAAHLGGRHNMCTREDIRLRQTDFSPVGVRACISTTTSLVALEVQAMR